MRMTSYRLLYEIRFQHFSRMYSYCINNSILTEQLFYAVPFVSWGSSLFISMQIKFRCQIQEGMCSVVPSVNNLLHLAQGLLDPSMLYQMIGSISF